MQSMVQAIIGNIVAGWESTARIICCTSSIQLAGVDYINNHYSNFLF